MIAASLLVQILQIQSSVRHLVHVASDDHRDYGVEVPVRATRRSEKKYVHAAFTEWGDVSLRLHGDGRGGIQRA